MANSDIIITIKKMQEPIVIVIHDCKTDLKASIPYRVSSDMDDETLENIVVPVLNYVANQTSSMLNIVAPLLNSLSKQSQSAFDCVYNYISLGLNVPANNFIEKHVDEESYIDYEENYINNTPSNISILSFMQESNYRLNHP